MNEEEIRKLIEEQKRYHLPECIVERELALALVKSGDPMFLLTVPEPFRTNIVKFGLEVTDSWFEISSAGTVDFSEHAHKLHNLVARFINEVPVGQYIHWHPRSGT